MENHINLLITEEKSVFSTEELECFNAHGIFPSFCDKDGTTVIEKINKKEPDVVVMELFMTRTEALGVLKEFQNSDKKPLFIITSTFDSDILQREIMSLGGSYFVLKPYSVKSLALCVTQLFKARNGLRRPVIKPFDDDAPNMEIRVTQILHQIGVPAHIKGYHYLRDSIIMCVENPDIINAVTRRLYPSVAEKYETTPSRVERAIRHAIEVAWDRGDIDILNSYFGYTIHNGRGKPTNSEFIAMISDKLRLRIKNAS
ncbi:MAG: sporulation transcription factor Spo0A [Clostridia bacterium]|nr:sporulation transcription factor Spo0A [Clostridia bacterium]